MPAQAQAVKIRVILVYDSSHSKAPHCPLTSRAVYHLIHLFVDIEIASISSILIPNSVNKMFVKLVENWLRNC